MPHTSRRAFAGAMLALCLTTGPVIAHADNLQNAIQAINVAKQLGGMFMGNKPAAQPQQQPVQHANPLTDSQLSNLQKIGSLEPKDWIAYGPSNPTAVVYTFTDATCPVSQKFHREMDQLTSKGVQVRTINWPRGPANGFAVHKNIWCSSNPRASMDKAMRKQTLPASACRPSQIEELQLQYNTGLDIGVKATPFFLFEDGSFLGGLPENPLYLAERAHEARRNVNAYYASRDSGQR